MMHSWRVRLVHAVAIPMVAAVALPGVLSSQAPVPASGGPPSLVTSGQGEAKVNPDRVSVLVNVQTRAATAAAAAAENARRTKAVLDALGQLGLPKDQLSTEGYSAYPEMRYDREGGSPKVTGYVVTNSVRAESKRVEQAGAIIDAALGAGANLINSLSFYASSIDEPRRQAIALAVASARADAEAMAQAAGGRLGVRCSSSRRRARRFHRAPCSMSRPVERSPWQSRPRSIPVSRR
jgi:uncharacterized protein